MEWTRKSEQSQSYCAVHNYQCPLHHHPDDPMVLDLAPHFVPGAWICPQAVVEISDFYDDAEMYIEENELVIPSRYEEVMAEAARLDGDQDLADKVRMDGVESLTIEELDSITAAIEEHQDELGSDAEATFELLLEEANK